MVSSIILASNVVVCHVCYCVALLKAPMYIENKAVRLAQRVIWSVSGAFSLQILKLSACPFIEK